MSDFVQHPHDKLFRTVFADTEEAALFLREHLPAALSERLDWPSLALLETSFVDEALRESESDLLYTVQMNVTAFCPASPTTSSTNPAWRRSRSRAGSRREWRSCS